MPFHYLRYVPIDNRWQTIFCCSTNHDCGVNGCCCSQATINLIYYLNPILCSWTGPSAKLLLTFRRSTFSTLSTSIYVRDNENLLQTIDVTSLGLPCVFGLLVNKKSVTYRQIFTKLKQVASDRGKTFAPATIISDFESGLLPVIKSEVSAHLFIFERCLSS